MSQQPEANTGAGALHGACHEDGVAGSLFVPWSLQLAPGRCVGRAGIAPLPQMLPRKRIAVPASHSTGISRTSSQDTLAMPASG